MNQAEIDHIEPKSKGGSNASSNAQVDNSAMNVPSRAFSNVPSVTDSNVPLQMWLL
jgi:hypothetical protein